MTASPSLLSTVVDVIERRILLAAVRRQMRRHRFHLDRCAHHEHRADVHLDRAVKVASRLTMLTEKNGPASPASDPSLGSNLTREEKS